MKKQPTKDTLIDSTAELFNEFRAQLVPEQGFSTAEFENKLRSTIGCVNQQDVDDAIDQLWTETNQDPVLVYYLDNLKVRRPEVLQWLAEVYNSESYDDPDLPTNRAAYWREFYEANSPMGLINDRLNGD